MISLKNNTRTKALIGYIVKKDSRRGGYLYVEPNATDALGVLVSEDKIAQTGEEALVYVNGYIKKGQIIRSFKYGDNGRPGQGFALADGYIYQHLQIGVALEAGRNNLIKASIRIETKGALIVVGGASAYEIAVTNGFIGTETEWLSSLRGSDGQDGTPGVSGYTPIKGIDYFDGLPGADGEQGPPGSDATVTKEAVETVLTGEISSHTHSSGGGLTQSQILTRQL